MEALDLKNDYAGGQPGAVDTSNYFRLQYSSLHSSIKTLIVRMALKGILSFRLADWLIQRGGLRHA